MAKNDIGSPEEIRLRTILDSMRDAVFVTDARGRVTLTNAALERLIEGRLLGRRAKRVLDNDELRAAVRRARKKGRASEVEIELAAAGVSKVRSLRAQVTPLPDGEGVVAVLHDVTSLRELDRVRRDFVANASHELRTPLTAIRGFAETLLGGALDDPKAASRFLDAILRNTRRLQRMAEALTLLSRAESPLQVYEAEPTDVGAVTDESLQSLSALSRERGIEVRVEGPAEPVVLRLPPRALEHVVINLVENAIKYSPAGSAVDVRLSREAEQVTLEVVDRGVGIPEKYRTRIFERFYRVDKGRSRDEGGTGLGLSIARHFVERMGGTLELESEVGVGSTFRVSLPDEE